MDYILLGRTGLSDEVAEDIIRACTPFNCHREEDGEEESEDDEEEEDDEDTSSEEEELRTKPVMNNSPQINNKLPGVESLGVNDTGASGDNL